MLKRKEPADSKGEIEHLFVFEVILKLLKG